MEDRNLTLTRGYCVDICCVHDIWCIIISITVFHDGSCSFLVNLHRLIFIKQSTKLPCAFSDAGISSIYPLHLFHLLAWYPGHLLLEDDNPSTKYRLLLLVFDSNLNHSSHVTWSLKSLYIGLWSMRYCRTANTFWG